jgi:hypothetical protein
LINRAMLGEFDTLVVELPPKRDSLPAGGPQLLSKPAEHVETSTEGEGLGDRGTQARRSSA